jgi:hypothetical protein
MNIVFVHILQQLNKENHSCDVICRDYTVICRDYTVVCRDYTVVCRDYKVICRSYKVIYRHCKVVCSAMPSSVLLCRRLLCYAVVCRNCRRVS